MISPVHQAKPAGRRFSDEWIYQTLYRVCVTLGLQVDRSGPTSLLIREIPALLKQGDAETLAADPEVRKVYLGERFEMAGPRANSSVTPYIKETQKTDDPDAEEE